jgi:FixJ family two-component response regulator
MTERAVLLVDADPAVRDSLTTLMDLNGFTVHSFSTGAAFLRELPECSVHCVICEADLPDTSGILIYQHLQTLNMNLPFALLVSGLNPAVVRSAHSAGINEIFQKPLVHRRLLNFVSTC